jgi:5-methyltetrahydropteroyltriglutamate--homocysteine methyltransferase
VRDNTSATSRVVATAVSHYPKVGDGPGQQRLRQTIAKVDRGEVGPEAIAEAAAAMTEAAIEEQEQAGLDLITDGQIRWQDPITRIAGALDGFEITGLVRWFESNTYFRLPRVTGEIAWRGPILAEDLLFAIEHARRPVKAVVTGPCTIAALSDLGGREMREVTLELARALNQELRALAAAGAAWVQVDEPALVRNASVEYPRDFDVFQEAMRVLLEDVPGRRSLYLYHGDAVDVPGLFDLPFDLIGLDFVQGDANLEFLQRWPRGCGLGLGVVDARNVRMEDEATVERLIGQAVEAVGDGEVHVSPSCGLEFLPRDVARRKLELIGRVVHGVEVGA